MDLVRDLSENNIDRLCDELKIEIKHEQVDEDWDVVRIKEEVEGKWADINKQSEFTEEDMKNENIDLDVSKYNINKYPGNSYDCNRFFSSNINPNKYFSPQTGETPYQYSGDNINSSLVDKHELLQHKKEYNSEKPRQCSQCGKSFVGREQLIKHLMTHFEESGSEIIDSSIRYSTKSVLNKVCTDETMVSSVKKDHEMEIKHKSGVGDYVVETTNHKYDVGTCRYSKINGKIKQEKEDYTDKLSLTNLKVLNAANEHELEIKQEPLEWDEMQETLTTKINDTEITPYERGNLSLKQEKDIKSESDANDIFSDVKENVGGKICSKFGNACQGDNSINEESVSFINKNRFGNDKKAYAFDTNQKSKSCNKAFTYNDGPLKPNKVIVGETLYPCNQCDKVFHNISNRRKHVKLHITDKPYKCIECGMTFLQKSYFTQHRLIHIEEKPHQCTQCDKSFTRKDNLIIHMKIHSVDTSYPRSLNKEAYSSDNNSTDKSLDFGHLVSYTNEKKYQCNLCEKAFSKNGNLLIHLRTHIEEKRFSCILCDKTFAGNHFLKRHMQIHSTEDLYQCQKCDRFFSDNDSLVSHLKTHSEEITYQCSLCKKTFSENIQMHGEKTNLCTLCFMDNSKNDDKKNRQNISSYNELGLMKKLEDIQNVTQDGSSKIIYIGCISNSTSSEIRKRFKKFGTIENISITFKGKRNSYGFITFKDYIEANQAIEYGNDDMTLPQYYICSKKKYEKDKLKERDGDYRVVYIGGIPEGTSKAELKDRFSKFGRIRDISMVFREQRNNYSHIRFVESNEACDAVKHGNDNTTLPYYYLSLSGRIKYEEDEFMKKQAKDQQIIYIGCIADGTTKTEIRDRFCKFGTIIDISLVFRDQRINYGFITYRNSNEAHEAISHGNDDTCYPQYNILSKKMYENDKVEEQVDDLRIMYIGCISDGKSLAGLRERFRRFGTIINIFLIYKNKRNNYGHIKFAHSHDAYKASVHGNDNTSLPQYYLCLRSKERKYEEDEYIKKQGQDRKVIYITDISEKTTNIDLKDRFGKFGTITYISLVSKGKDNHFSFIAFTTHDEAYAAVKHGNDDPSLPHYYIQLGGRREFCKRGYADLDAQNTDNNGNKRVNSSVTSGAPMDFDDLLKAAMKKKR